MERREVIVAGKVFDLGLKGLDDAIREGERDGQTMELEVAGVFQGPRPRSASRRFADWSSPSSEGRRLYPEKHSHLVMTLRKAMKGQS